MIGAIFATDEANGFGYQNKIPWHIPEDFTHFKKVTFGGTIVMGRNTFQSLPKLLPNRNHVVLSKSLQCDQNVSVYDDPLTLLNHTGNNFWVIGGPSIIETFHNLIGYDVIYHSVISGEHTVDVSYDPTDMLQTMGYADKETYDDFTVMKYVSKHKF